MPRITWIVLSLCLIFSMATPIIAQDTAQSAICDSGDDAKMYLKLADESIAQEDYELALAYYTYVLEIKPNNAEAYYDFAVVDFTRVITLDPAYPGVYFQRALTYEYLGNYDGAITDYTRAIELGYEPLDLAYELRGLTYLDLGEHDKAAADFRQYEQLTGHLEDYMEIWGTDTTPVAGSNSGTSPALCYVFGINTINRRSGPGTNYAAQGTLTLTRGWPFRDSKSGQLASLGGGWMMAVGHAKMS